MTIGSLAQVQTNVFVVTKHVLERPPYGLDVVPSNLTNLENFHSRM